jgi:hypothetical protein
VVFLGFSYNDDNMSKLFDMPLNLDGRQVIGSSFGMGNAVKDAIKTKWGVEFGANGKNKEFLENAAPFLF